MKRGKRRQSSLASRDFRNGNPAAWGRFTKVEMVKAAPLIHDGWAFVVSCGNTVLRPRNWRVFRAMQTRVAGPEVIDEAGGKRDSMSCRDADIPFH